MPANPALAEALANKRRVHISIFKTKHGRWAYCPTLALHSPTMRNCFLYGTEGWETQAEAVEAVKRDTTVPKNSVVHIEE